MNPSLYKLMTSNQKAALLLKLAGQQPMPEWLLENLQDDGLIDHKNNLTAAGEKLVSTSSTARS
jgi:hypothetical protein